VISLFIHSRTGECGGIGGWFEKGDEYGYTIYYENVYYGENHPGG